MSPRLGCRSERARLASYLDDRGDSLARLAFERHLESCADCRRAVEFESAVEEALHRAVGPDFDAEFETRIVTGVRARLDGLESVPAGRSPVRFGRIRPAMISAIAAAILAAIVLGVSRSRFGASDDLDGSRRETASNESHPAAPERSDPSPSISEESSLDLAAVEAVRRQVRESLANVARASALPKAIPEEIAKLAAEDWPIPALLRAAIDDPDPAVSIGAMRVAVAADIPACAPAMRRAASRSATAAVAIESLGRVGDLESVDRIERALRSSELASAAIAALVGLGGEPSVARLASALSEPHIADDAFEALLALESPGLGELLVHAGRGDVFVATELEARGLPTFEQLERIARTSSTPERVLAAIERLSRFGDRAIPCLLPLLSTPATRDSALDALTTIGTRASFESLLAASVRGAAPEASIGRAVRAILDGFLDPTAIVERAAASEQGPTLIAILLAADPRDDESLAMLIAIASEPRVPLESRVDIAFFLADRGRLSRPLALALASESLAAGRAGLAARALLAAAHAGADLDVIARSRVAPSLREVCSKAEQIASRWRRDGSPPTEAERAGLVRRLDRTLP